MSPPEPILPVELQELRTLLTAVSGQIYALQAAAAGAKGLTEAGLRDTLAALNGLYASIVRREATNETLALLVKVSTLPVTLADCVLEADGLQLIQPWLTSPKAEERERALDSLHVVLADYYTFATDCSLGVL